MCDDDDDDAALARVTPMLLNHLNTFNPYFQCSELLL